MATNCDLANSVVNSTVLIYCNYWSVLYNCGNCIWFLSGGTALTGCVLPFRADKAAYLVQVDVDDVDVASGTASKEAVWIPLDRVRVYQAPWLLPGLPSPPPRP